ncbi:17988_t:CDS:2 [Funneliformis geosporum]|nr:17988_t:CDS:2 [Funneliformis geosporum]
MKEPIIEALNDDDNGKIQEITAPINQKENNEVHSDDEGIDGNDSIDDDGVVDYDDIEDNDNNEYSNFQDA